MKNRSHRYGINRPRSRHGHVFRHSYVVNIKNCLSMMMLTYINQHQSNIWSSIHEKVQQYWGWIGKSLADKKACIFKHMLYFQTNASHGFTAGNYMFKVNI